MLESRLGRQLATVSDRKHRPGAEMGRKPFGHGRQSVGEYQTGKGYGKGYIYSYGMGLSALGPLVRLPGKDWPGLQ